MSAQDALAQSIFGSKPQPLHLGISVADLGRSIAWYRDTLGFSLVRRADLSASLHVAILEYHGFGIELIAVRDSAKNQLAFLDPGAQHLTQGIVHFAFEVPDLERVEQVLRSRGVQFACEPTTLEPLGIRFFHVFDPDGNLLEFGQRLAA